MISWSWKFIRYIW